MKHDLLMPRLNVNDDYIVLSEWLVEDTDKVTTGQSLAIIETTKEVSEVTSDTDGYIQIYVSQGTDVKVGECIATVFDHKKELLNENPHNAALQPERITKPARKLIEQYHISPELLPRTGLIKEKDILKIITVPKDKLPATPKDLLIFGGGGCCKIALDILKQTGAYHIAGILERKYPDIQELCGIPVIAKSSEEDVRAFYEKGFKSIFNSVVFDGKKHGRKAPYELLKAVGFECISLIHRNAILEPTVSIGEGTIVAAGAIIGSYAQIGCNCFINAGSIISHDCIIGNHSHIASGAVLGGSVYVGENSLIGQGCTVFKDVKIGKNVVIMNGVNVFGNVPDNTTVDS